jgi:hypothetical protein
LAKAPSEKTLDELAEDMHTRPEGLTHLMAKAEMELRRTEAQRHVLHVRGFDRRGDVRSSGCDHRGHRGVCRLSWRMRSNEATPLSSRATASPSMMQERERRRASASTISGKRRVRSLLGTNKIMRRLLQLHHQKPAFFCLGSSRVGGEGDVVVTSPGPLVGGSPAGRGAHAICALPDLCVGIVSERLEFLWTLSPLD